MRRPGTKTQIGWLMLGALIGAIGALGADPTSELGGYHPVEFNNLSHQQMSRRGAAALNMPSIKWVHGESDHFIYHFEQGFLCPQFATATELFYRRIKEHLGITEDSYERKGQIFVFLGTNYWDEFSNQVRLEKWTGAFQSGNELFVTARANQKLDYSPSIPHEITHLVVNRFVGDVPLWLNEGIAEFEGYRQRAMYLRQRLSNRQIIITTAPLPREQIMPLRKFTELEDYPEDDVNVEAFYTQAELLVKFLFVECGGQEPFLKFVKLQSRGLKFGSSLDQVYGGKFRDTEAFEESFVKYVLRKDRPR